jgi:predicted acylesterase/phospholipase RssA/CRP-like cAMP-binding protein
MTDDKYLLLKMHPCSHGLTDEAVREIADATELMHLSPGDCLQEADEPVTSISLVIQGRLKQSLIDVHGNYQMLPFETAGGQFGGLLSALAEPGRVTCSAEDPTTLLRLDYQDALMLTTRHEVFRLNVLRMVAEGVQHKLSHEKHPVRPRLVLMLHQSPETRVLSRKVIERLRELAEPVCVITDQTEWEPIEGVRHRYVFEGGRELEETQVRNQLVQWSDSPRIIVDEASRDLAESAEVWAACEMVLWCVTPQNWKDSVQQLEAIKARVPSWGDKVCIVWMLDREQTAPLASELTELARTDIKVSFAEPGKNQGRALNHGFERLIHLLRGIQIGVALGGGAARGMVHLGVLKALEQNGIIVDMIAGTSAGAMTGTFFASGLDVDYSINGFVRDMRPSSFFRLLPGGDQWYLVYKYRSGQFDPMLRKYLRDERLEQYPVAMHAITVDLVGAEVVIRNTGDAVHAILESINLPLLSKPINRQGQALVDGGMLNNIPADVLVSKGCNFVIAVSVTAKVEHEFAHNRPDTPISKMKSASAIHTLLRTYLVQNANLNAIGVAPADIVIEPDATGFELTEFARTDELSAIGEQTTLESIPRIKELLAQLDGDLFPLTN